MKHLDALDAALHRLDHGDISRCITPEQAAQRDWPVVQCLWESPIVGERQDKARRLLALLAEQGLTVVEAS